MPRNDEMIGRTIGKCRLLGRLGHGKTSSLYRAFYEPLQKEVAVKVLKEDMKASREIRDKFLNEARALAKLDHMNIVKVFDVVEDSEHLLIIMELLHGSDLYRLLGEQGPFEAPRAVEIVAGAAQALLQAHRQGIVHRDVKPHNLMLVGRREQVKLVDFGLATEGAVEGTKAGTPHYMSPEQIQGKKVDEKSDIYSLGATFFHLLTGRPPYPGKTREEILEKHLAGKLPSVSRANREVDVPPALDPVVKRMMAPVPGYRFSAGDLISTLEGLNLAARRRSRKAHTARAATAKARSGPLLIGGALGVVAIAVVLLVLLLSGGKGPASAPGPAAPGGGGGAAGGPAPVGLKDRGQERENRDVLADNAFRLAQSFEAQNYGRRDAVYAEYKKVFDEYGETGAGSKARDKMRVIEDQIRAEKQAADAAAKEGSRKEKRAKLDENLKRLLAAYDFPAATRALEDFQLEFDDKALWKVHRRLSYAQQFLLDLGKAISSNDRKYEVSRFKPSAPATARIESADEKGLRILEGTFEKIEPWSYLAPKELARLASFQFASRDAISLCHLGLFLIAVGEQEEGEGMIDQARVWDELGRVQQILDQIEKGR
ncbi:MAG: serine/threonine protein kinase [Planctomycetes bacterium]|jgi:tRNA A-37 threonylcarbamoyl transferase component Bud32|nr:serine/threonine protein kinase [Planctomycetota bacterium]